MVKPYKVQPSEIRKLGSLLAEFVFAAKAAKTAWRNEEFDAAKRHMKEANEAYARLQAYFNKLVGWQESGVRASWAK